MYDKFTDKLEQYGVDRFLRELGAKNVTGNGKDFRSSCPAHGGDNPNALHYHDGFFTCFTGCNKTYNAPSLLSATLNISYPSAIKKLEDTIGETYGEGLLDLDKSSIDNREFIRLAKRTLSKSKESQFAEYDLSDERVYVPMLHESLYREGFGAITLNQFDIRYCTQGYFKDRIIIPIHSPDGKVAGIAGRSTKSNKEIDMKRLSKYVFSKGLRKGETLYNYHNVKGKDFGYIIVVEGYKSVWRLSEWGYKNAVAIMGSKITDRQIMLLLKLGKPVIISGDNDEAGREMERQIHKRIKDYTYSFKFDIETLNVNRKDSIAELTREQFETRLKDIFKKERA